MKSTPGAGHGGPLRVEYPNRVGSVGKVLTAVGEAEDAVDVANSVRTRGRTS
jgi:hypothetical protein